MFRIPKDAELTLPLLQEFLDKHRREVNGRYKRLHDAYTSDHDILHQAAKPSGLQWSLILWKKLKRQ